MENIATFIANPLFSAVQSLLTERDPILEGNYDFDYSRDMKNAQEIIEDSDSDVWDGPPHEEFSDADISDDDMDLW